MTPIQGWYACVQVHWRQTQKAWVTQQDRQRLRSEGMGNVLGRAPSSCIVSDTLGPRKNIMKHVARPGLHSQRIVFALISMPCDTISGPQFFFLSSFLIIQSFNTRCQSCGSSLLDPPHASISFCCLGEQNRSPCSCWLLNCLVAASSELLTCFVKLSYKSCQAIVVWADECFFFAYGKSPLQ